MSVEALLAWNDRQRALVGGWLEWRQEHDLLAEGLACSLLAELPRYRAEAAGRKPHVPAEKVPVKARAPVEVWQEEVSEELTEQDNLLVHEMVARACQAAAEAQEEVEARTVAQAAAEAEARAKTEAKARAAAEAEAQAAAEAEARAKTEAKARAAAEAEARVAAEAEARAKTEAKARAAAQAEARAREVVAPASSKPAAKAPTEEETAKWLDSLDRPQPPLDVGEQGEFAGSSTADDGSEVGVRCRFASVSHIGGSGKNRQKENQDAMFVVRGERTMVWGVLDGHGPDNGRLAAHGGVRAFKAWFAEHEVELESDPQVAMTSAFRAAHDAIRQLMVTRYERQGEPLKTTAGGYLVGEEGEPVDGGATATVAALVHGHLLVIANVGDSDALLGGKLPDGTIGFEQLCADHSPTSADEFVRVQRFGAQQVDAWEPPLFAYTAGDEPLEIFAVGADGTVELDPEALRQLDEMGAGYKTARGDRPTAVVATETREYEECQLGVTRSLGDFYLQHFGVTWEPSVSCIDLLDMRAQLEQVTLVIASDGLWDLWQYKDVLQYPLGPPANSGAVLAPLLELVEETRSQGEELFGDSADNITVVTITVAFGESASQPAAPVEEVLFC